MVNFAPVIAAATLFAQSYNQTMEVYRQGASSQVYAASIASYYQGPMYVGFWGGTSLTNLTQAAIAASTKVSIDFLDKKGYGYNIRVKNFRVDPYSEDAAAVWLSWNLHPNNGERDLEWETLYGYRMQMAANPTQDQDIKTKCGLEESLACKFGGKDKVKGWWEFTSTDNEIRTFTERIPDYLDSYKTPQ
jgi:hypothetical protein